MKWYEPSADGVKPTKPYCKDGEDTIQFIHEEIKFVITSGKPKKGYALFLDIYVPKGMTIELQQSHFTLSLEGKTLINNLQQLKTVGASVKQITASSYKFLPLALPIKIPIVDEAQALHLVFEENLPDHEFKAIPPEIFINGKAFKLPVIHFKPRSKFGVLTINC